MRIRSLPLCIGSAVSSAALLGAGWLWARLLLSAYQRHEGTMSLSASALGAHYQFWGLSVPRAVTANVLILIALVSLFALWRRRDFFSLLALSGCFTVLAGAWFFLFVDLDVEAFD